MVRRAGFLALVLTLATTAACGSGSPAAPGSNTPTAAVLGSGTTTAGPADRTPAAPSARPTPSTVDGTAFYFRTTGTKTQVYSMTKGVVTLRYRISAASTDVCVGNSVIVSPDGKRLAWIEGPATGTLTIATLDGAAPRTLGDVFCLLDDRNWSDDSRTLSVIVDRGDLRQPTRVNAATGAVEPIAANDGTIWSANGAFRAKRANDHSSFTVLTAAGAVVRTITNYTNDSGTMDRCGFLLRGLSDDGRYVAISPCSTDPSRNLGANYLFDTMTGKHVTLPLAHVDHIGFLGGGTVLLHGDASGTRTIALMSATATVIASRPEPADLRDAIFLSYTPA